MTCAFYYVAGTGDAGTPTFTANTTCASCGSNVRYSYSTVIDYGNVNSVEGATGFTTYQTSSSTSIPAPGFTPIKNDTVVGAWTQYWSNGNDACPAGWNLRSFITNNGQGADILICDTTATAGVATGTANATLMGSLNGVGGQLGLIPN
jgi:hypothetical protein